MSGGIYWMRYKREDIDASNCNSSRVRVLTTEFAGFLRSAPSMVDTASAAVAPLRSAPLRSSTARPNLDKQKQSQTTTCCSSDLERSSFGKLGLSFSGKCHVTAIGSESVAASSPTATHLYPSRNTSSVLRPLRLFHSSLLAANYFGPPDPMSNIRLVIYHNLDPTNVESPQHLYSSDEFRTCSSTSGSCSGSSCMHSCSMRIKISAMRCQWITASSPELPSLGAASVAEGKILLPR